MGVDKVTTHLWWRWFLTGVLLVWFVLLQMCHLLESRNAPSSATDTGAVQFCRGITSTLTDSEAAQMKKAGRELLMKELSDIASALIDRETTFLTIRAGAISVFLAVLSFAFARNGYRNKEKAVSKGTKILDHWFLWLVVVLVMTIYAYDRLQSHYADRSSHRGEVITKTVLQYGGKSPQEMCEVVLGRYAPPRNDICAKFLLVINPELDHWMVYGPLWLILLWIRPVVSKFGWKGKGAGGTEASHA